MIKLEIVLHPDQKLKRICIPIARITDNIKLLAAQMLDTMYKAPGIGMAAPQVGILKRIFVMDCADESMDAKPFVLINPEITWVSEEKSKHEEGCLSIPDFYGEVERPKEVKIKCLDKDGFVKEFYFKGLEATCAQHEIDHLNGVLFIDYLSPIRRGIITSKMKKFKKKNYEMIRHEKTLDR